MVGEDEVCSGGSTSILLDAFALVDVTSLSCFNSVVATSTAAEATDPVVVLSEGPGDASLVGREDSCIAGCESEDIFGVTKECNSFALRADLSFPNDMAVDEIAVRASSVRGQTYQHACRVC